MPTILTIAGRAATQARSCGNQEVKRPKRGPKREHILRRVQQSANAVRRSPLPTRQCVASDEPSSITPLFSSMTWPNWLSTSAIIKACSDCGTLRIRSARLSTIFDASASGSFSPPAICCLQSAEVAAPKSDSKSVAYEIRTKSAQSGGLERNGLRERISALGGYAAVRRFFREALGYWLLCAFGSRRRMLVAIGLAERESS